MHRLGWIGGLLLTGMVSAVPAAETTARYIVTLQEAPLARYHGEGGFAAPSRIAGGKHNGRLDVHSKAALDYVGHLQQTQSQFASAIGQALHRNVTVVYRLQHALNAIVVDLTPSEAAQLAARSDVKRVEPDQLLHVAAESDPSFIGADAIWDGSAANGVSTQGEGIVVGVVDTGINWQSPSFAATGGDGYAQVNPLGAGQYLGGCAAGQPDAGHCNDKLIGMYNMIDATQSATDPAGHGSHTSSTAAGDHRSATFGGGTFSIAGVAPHASIVMYLACNADGTCPESATAAGVDQAVADGIVDVINYSIDGGVDPWNDAVSQAFLSAVDAGVFVATAAGNAGPDPGTVSHVEPWTITAAASTLDQTVSFDFSLTSDGAPSNTQHIALRPGSPPVQAADIVDAPLIVSPTFSDTFSDGCNAFASNTFTRGGVAAVAVMRLSVSQSACASIDRAANAIAAGALGTIFVDDTLYLNLGAAGDSWSMLSVDWQNVAAAIATSPSTATASLRLPASLHPMTPDIVAAFSSRGPSPNVGGSFLLKPDIAAPGVDVLAAFSGDAQAMALEDGTSMASPHMAGSAALLRALHGDWSVSEIKSALEMYSKTAGITTQELPTATPWDRGHGRVDLALAAEAPLVMDESADDYANADPNGGGDPSTLNIPGVAIANCTTTSCSFTRTVRNTTSSSLAFDVTTTGMQNVTVTPTSFSIEPNATQTITISPFAAVLPSLWSFGEVQFTSAAQGIAPAHFAFAVQRSNGVPLIKVSSALVTDTEAVGATSTQTLALSDVGTASIHWSIDTTSAGCALPSWLGYSPASGTVLGGGLSKNVTLTFNASNVTPGTYGATLCVASDDSANPTVPVAVQLIATPNDRIFADGFE